MPRFSDTKLEEFYQEFEEHKGMFEAHRLEQLQLHNEMLEAIRDNTAVVATLTKRTEGIIEVWESSQGAVKVLRWIGSTIKWLAGVGVAIAGAWFMLKNGK